MDIYDSWKRQLDKLGIPYYLKIWLFEPRFAHSQVVCAINDKIEEYENNFYKPELIKLIKLDNYGELKKRLKNYNWEHRIDENYYDNTEVGESNLYDSIEDYEYTKIWFNKLLKKSHRKVQLSEPNEGVTEMYFIKRGIIWVGGQK